MTILGHELLAFGSLGLLLNKYQVGINLMLTNLTKLFFSAFFYFVLFFFFQHLFLKLLVELQFFLYFLEACLKISAKTLEQSLLAHSQRSYKAACLLIIKTNWWKACPASCTVNLRQKRENVYRKEGRGKF